MESEDKTYCPKESCKRIKCWRNPNRIRDHTIPHSFFVEIPADCPYRKNKPDENHGIYHVRKRLQENV